MTSYLESVIADIMSHCEYTLSTLNRKCPDCDTTPDFALFLTHRHLDEIRSWRAPIEISRGPEGRYLEDMPTDVQAIEVFLEFLRALDELSS